jgi:elongation factor 1 alpha-like protein
MRKGGNNYEDELYEDDYYDDDDDYNYEDDYYEEEEIEYKTKNKTKNKTPANIKAQKVTTTTNKQPPQPKPEINQPPKKTTTESKESKTKTDLNSIKYPKISYKINNKKNERNDINIVIIGHVDSGKSTLMGHLLYLLGEIDKKSLQNTSKSFKKTGTNQLHFAWATDEGTDERERGVTIDVAYKTFKTKNKNVTAMDAPGHRDFIPNMITGTAAADAAILVIDSGKQAFDAGFFNKGQTKEHAILAKTLGVKEIIVVVNLLEFKLTARVFTLVAITQYEFVSV